jgi:hypothetical protein
MIICRALEEQSIFVTAKGELVPCCFVYHGGPNQLRDIIKEENFGELQKTWDTETPFGSCYRTCDTRTKDSDMNISKFDNQWRTN